jgi:hypothetical protein
VFGYSRLKVHRQEFLEPLLAEYQGRIVNSALTKSFPADSLFA